jgi:type I restriction enzyme, S subunit
MKPYPKYKDSGVEWLGEIPEHWNIKRLKFLSDIQTGEKDTVDNEENGEYPFFVRSQTIERINSYSYDGEAVLTAGDGVGVAKVFHYYHGKFDYHQRVYKISDFKEVIGRYFFYYISDNFHKEVMKISAKSTVDSLRLPMFLDFPVAFGDADEQYFITTYLDRKTSQIDTLIEKKQKQIALLKEYRTAIINQAVTKGLNPDVKMKDSGIEWLGEIPEHWEVTRLKYIGEAIIGITYTPDEVTDGQGVLVLRASNIQNGKLSLDDCIYIDKNIPPKLRIKKGDILICSRSGSRDLIGKNILIDEKVEGSTFGTFMTVFRTEQYKFLSRYFNSQIFIGQSGLFLTSTINQLTINTLNNFLIALPPAYEQQQIDQYLEFKTAQIDNLIQNTQNQIDQYKEYRTTLISEAVTGKIDVRDEVVS